jgi:hypothetical protein
VWFVCTFALSGLYQNDKQMINNDMTCYDMMTKLFFNIICCRLTERFNQTLITHLMKVVNADADDWDDHVDPILFGYRINAQSSTKFSPFELMYGQKARIPVDLEGETDVGVEDCPPDGIEQRVVDIAERCVRVREEGLKNIGRAQGDQKMRYDLKHSGPTYKVGDRVMKCNRRRETRMGDKLAHRYHGPYTITELVGKGCYRVSDGEKVLKQAVNAVNLKEYHEPHSPSLTPRKSPGYSASPGSPKSPKVKRRLTDIMVKSSPPSVPWLPKFNLDSKDKGIIDSGEWLNDKIMDTINKMAEFQRGGDNNQSTLMVQGAGGFNPVNGEVIQVLHDTNHWVAVTVVEGEILLADSGNKPISPYVVQQMKQLFPTRLTRDGRLNILRVPCDIQPNGRDCGVYAAAFVSEWANGGKTCDVGYVNVEMRAHLVRCLEQGVLELFPRSGVRRRGRKRQAIHHTVM